MSCEILIKTNIHGTGVVNYTHSDPEKDKRGVYKKGYPVGMEDAPRSFRGYKEGLPHFCAINVTDASMAEVEAMITSTFSEKSLNQSWERQIDFTTVNNNPTIDGWRIKVFTTVVTFVEASLTIETVLFLAGIIDANSAISASARIVREFSGLSSTISDIGSDLGIDRSLSGVIDVGTTIAGLINILRSLSGDIAVSTTLVANINRLIDLTGTIDVFTGLSSSSNIIRDLSGYIDTVTSTSGFLRNNVGLSGAINIVTYLIGTLHVYDPDAFKEIIYLISAINKEVTGDSQITKLLNYSSGIETVVSKIGTITKVLNIMSNLDYDLLELDSAITKVLSSGSDVTKIVSDGSSVTTVYSYQSSIDKILEVISPLNNEDE